MNINIWVLKHQKEKKKTAEEWHVFIAPRLAGQEPEHPDKEAKDNE